MNRPNNMSVSDSVSRLKEGNRRYVSGDSQYPNNNPHHRQTLVKGQAPFAIILTCADSRVSPELVFDQGLGDLFVIRVAGNILDDAVLGSIEYAAIHLGVNLIMVMGHESCGAVGAAIQGDETQLHIDELVRAIRPAVERAQERGGDLLDESVRENSRYVAHSISTAKPVMDQLCADSLVEVAPAYYSLATGEVTIL